MDRRDREYEYKIEVIPAADTRTVDVEAALTRLGICGWQLVTIQGDRYFFERPR